MATKTERPSRDRQIIGLSLPPALAREVKAEAAKRGLSLRRLFEELWDQYRKTKPAKGSV